MRGRGPGSSSEAASGMARAGKNGTHAMVDSSAAVVTAASWSRACWPGRHSSHRARSWVPVIVPQPVALRNLACGGQTGLNACVALRSARPVPMIVPIAAPLRIRRLILMPVPVLVEVLAIVLAAHSELLRSSFTELLVPLAEYIDGLWFRRHI